MPQFMRTTASFHKGENIIVSVSTARINVQYLREQRLGTF
jgi:hypothetical protein